jgi:hypothetical protein
MNASAVVAFNAATRAEDPFPRGRDHAPTQNVDQCAKYRALYRRWPAKASLAADAVKAVADAGPAFASSDPLADLAAELADFQRGVSRHGQLSLVGTRLQDGTAPAFVADRAQNPVAKSERGTVASTCCW